MLSRKLDADYPCISKYSMLALNIFKGLIGKPHLLAFSTPFNYWNILALYPKQYLLQTFPIIISRTIHHLIPFQLGLKVHSANQNSTGNSSAGLFGLSVFSI